MNRTEEVDVNLYVSLLGALSLPPLCEGERKGRGQGRGAERPRESQQQGRGGRAGRGFRCRQSLSGSQSSRLTGRPPASRTWKTSRTCTRLRVENMARIRQPTRNKVHIRQSTPNMAHIGSRLGSAVRGGCGVQVSTDRHMSKRMQCSERRW